MKTDNVSYIEGESTITVKVNPSVTQSYSELFYKICYTLEFHTTPLVLACTTGSKVQFNTTVKWPKSGLALITARVFANGSEASMIGCGYADVTIAGTFVCVCVCVVLALKLDESSYTNIIYSFVYVSPTVGAEGISTLQLS